jgi:putative ABC transport system ATP-binding protein
MSVNNECKEQIMLTMNNITKVFVTGDVQTHALRDFSLRVNEGDFVSVTGPSGSGKTTFLNIAGLLETHSEGQFLLDGEDVSKLNDAGRSAMRNQKIGFIFQSFNLIPDLNLFDNVDVPLRYRGFNAKQRKQRIEENLEMVGLASRMKHLPSQLSGGQQQRVAIARALATSPRFLLADEPTGNLDTQMAQSVMSLLEEINHNGTTIIMVTHDDELARRASRNIHIKDGRVNEIDLVKNLNQQAIA